MFSDLECDYINPIDLCNKLNQVSPFPVCIADRLMSRLVVCLTREYCTRLPHATFPPVGPMVRLLTQSSAYAV